MQVHHLSPVSTQVMWLDRHCDWRNPEGSHGICAHVHTSRLIGHGGSHMYIGRGAQLCDENNEDAMFLVGDSVAVLQTC